MGNAQPQAVSLVGVPATIRAIDKLSLGLRKKIIGNIVRDIGLQLVAPAQAAAPVRKTDLTSKSHRRNPPGTLRESVDVVSRFYRGGQLVFAYVGPRWPKGAAGHLVEGGTKDRYRHALYTSELGKKKRIAGGDIFSGHVTPKPWLVPSTAPRLAQVQTEIQAAINAECDRIAAEGYKPEAIAN